MVFFGRADLVPFFFSEISPCVLFETCRFFAPGALNGVGLGNTDSGDFR